jgi:hypothetical protein
MKIIFERTITTSNNEYIKGQEYDISQEDFNIFNIFADIVKMKENNLDVSEIINKR